MYGLFSVAFHTSSGWYSTVGASGGVEDEGYSAVREIEASIIGGQRFSPRHASKAATKEFAVQSELTSPAILFMVLIRWGHTAVSFTLTIRVT